ncbi:MAG: CDP-diacylglycerol--glycerol-3-phosphate 3-phosphatidyltransferase [Oscillospiraceae bacterium]|jgi:CDP-diacylglycerol--glycerol-3-phosphate 3-phosphatidyltransferase|nr:CDP-diacylglycerol--glycerol-3-phosphate 3-phosphatidyltransferase [Oscillospiraceae bacterium]
MNTANKLTMVRVVLIPVFLVVLYLGFVGSAYIAMLIFIIASLTDLADGYIARSRQQVTNFGKFMDPLADKVLVFAAMLWFVERGSLSAWIVLIVVVREFAVTALRLIAVDTGRVIAAAKSGKVKTATTMLCLIVMFLGLPAWGELICAALIVGTTVFSGIEYFIKNGDVLKGAK